MHSYNALMNFNFKDFDGILLDLCGRVEKKRFKPISLSKVKVLKFHTIHEELKSFVEFQ